MAAPSNWSEDLIEKAARAGFDAVYHGEHPEYWWDNERERCLVQTKAILEFVEKSTHDPR